MTKAAVVMLGKMLALDGGPDGGVLERAVPRRHLAGHAAYGPPGDQDRGEENDGWLVPPIGRVGQARDVAAAAVFYASEDAGFVTGTTLLVDGWMTAGYLQRERSTQAGS